MHAIIEVLNIHIIIKNSHYNINYLLNLYCRKQRYHLHPLCKISHKSPLSAIELVISCSFQFRNCERYKEEMKMPATLGQLIHVLVKAFSRIKHGTDIPGAP